MKEKKDQVTTDPRAIEEYNRAIAEGIVPNQLISPELVRVWKTAKRSGRDFKAFSYNVFRDKKKIQQATYNIKNGVLQIEFHYYLPIDHDNIPDLITMMKDGKRQLMNLLGKKEGHQLIYVLDGQLSRKNKGMYYTYAELTTRLSDRPSEITLYEIERIFNDVKYHDRHGVNQWEKASRCTLQKDNDE